MQQLHGIAWTVLVAALSTYTAHSDVQYLVAFFVCTTYNLSSCVTFDPPGWAGFMELDRSR